MGNLVFRLIGIFLLIFSIVLFWFARDIFIEMFNGRDLHELPVEELVYPLLVMILSMIFLFYKSNNEKKRT